MNAKLAETGRKLLPPNWYWGLGQVIILVAAAINLGLHLQLDALAADADAIVLENSAYPNRPIEELPKSDADLLASVCPGPARDAMETLVFVDKLTQLVSECDLVIESTEHHDLPPKVGEKARRRRSTWAIRGSASDQIKLIGKLLSLSAPVILDSFRWAAGDGPHSRQLELTIDLLYFG